MVRDQHINRRTELDHVEIIVILFFLKDLKATLINFTFKICLFSNRKVACQRSKTRCLQWALWLVTVLQLPPMLQP